MIELSRRWGPGFAIAFVGLLGLSLTSHIYIKSTILTVIFAILALFSLVVIVIALYYDFKDARKKDKETKKLAGRKALRASFKRANPNWTDKQLDIAVDPRGDDEL